MSGWIYAVYHEASPPREGDPVQTFRIKFGRSKHHPNRDSLDGRVRKLDLALVALGFGPSTPVVHPFQVKNAHAFETALKRKLTDAKAIEPRESGYLTEVCRLPLAAFVSIIDDLKKQFA